MVDQQKHRCMSVGMLELFGHDATTHHEEYPTLVKYAVDQSEY